MTAQNERRTTAWEQHFSTIANGVMVAGILFLGSQFWSMNNKLIEFSITSKYLVESVNELKIQIRDLNNNYVNKVEFKELEIRVGLLERKK